MQKLLRVISVILITIMVTSPPAFSGGGFSNSGSSSGGSGDVVGPASALDNSIPRFDTTTGKLLQGETRGVVNYSDEGVFRASGYSVTMVATPTAPSAVDAGVAGNPTGALKYKVSYYTTNASVVSETDVSSASGTVTVTNSQVTVTIPTSSDTRVRGRRIYRTLAGGSVYYFLANVTNNTATTYTDNILDATISTNAREHRVNTTGPNFLGATNGTTMAGFQDGTTACFGSSSCNAMTYGYQNTAVGADSQRYNTTGINNTSVGQRSCEGLNGSLNFTGDYNTCIGRSAGEALLDASRNTLVGAGAGFDLESGSHNNVTGVDALNAATEANDNQLMGYHVLVSATGTITDNVIIGSNALDALGSGEGVTRLHVFGSQAQATNGVTEGGCIGYGCQVTLSNSFNFGTQTDYMSVRVRPRTAETVTAGATITADACLSTKFITADSVVTTSKTNTFTTPSSEYVGCVMNVINTGANTITLDANTNFKTSGGSDVSLTQYDSVVVSTDGTFWYQTAPVVANS